MDTISPLDSAQNVQMLTNSVHPYPPPGPQPMPGPQPEPGPRPEPGPKPGPMPPPPPPTPAPQPDQGNFVGFLNSLTPTERADAVPTAMQLENLEMANQYQQDYEDAVNADNPGGTDNTTGSTSSTTSSSGLSSPEFYVDMYKDSKAMNVNDWVQQHLYELENLDSMRNQFNFNTYVVVNTGAANGMNIPPDFMANQSYQAASGGVGPVAGATSAAGAYQNLQDYFSPENVAGRSVDMMVSMYTGSARPGGDSATSRQGYADTMRSMTERSYEQARNQISGSGFDSREALSQTADLINKGLDNFVQNGPNPAKNQPGGVYDQLRVYANSNRTSYAPTPQYGEPAVQENLALGGMPSQINTEA